jgi:antitoxin component HigA of HigAB toxin-antitoxin module
MYKTHEKYYIIIMSVKNDEEYHAALENFVKLFQQGPNNEELLYR